MGDGSVPALTFWATPYPITHRRIVAARVSEGTLCHQFCPLPWLRDTE
jgi:hypothetical protein